MGGAIQYAYDQAGQLTLRTDAGGNTRAYAYNAAGRMTREEHKLQGTTLDQTISYRHDKDGQLTGYEQNNGSGTLISSATYSKDAQGRTSQSNVAYGKVDGSGNFSFSIGQSFNADGQLQSHTYPDGSQQSYAYASGRLAKVTLPNGSEIGYDNYRWQLPGQITVPGAAKTLTYDSLLRPVGIEIKNQAAQILTKRAYQYDPAGNITEIESDLGKTTYGYDALDRLTQASPDTALQSLGLPQEQYSYDPLGNRTTSAHQPGVWSYNGDNQLIQYPRAEPFSGQAAQDTRISYTAQGHTAQEKAAQGLWQREYRYNAAERLVEVSQGGQTVTYRYDPLGRRISKTVGQMPGASTIYYLYTDSGLMAEADSQGTMTKAYGWNPVAAQQGLWSTDPIWQAEISQNDLAASATQYHYLQTDHLGTPMMATVKNGGISWKGVSEAFGATNAIVNAIEMNLRFPGQYWDRETNYNYRRDYDFIKGRYLQGDPIGLDGGVGLYGYSFENPMVNFDEKGLSCQSIKIPRGVRTAEAVLFKGDWGKWSAKGVLVEGGEAGPTRRGPGGGAFFLAYWCECERERSVDIRRKMVFMWRVVVFCIQGCSSYKYEYNDESLIFEYFPQTREKERRVVAGGFSMNEVDAKYDCDGKCENLNKK